MRLGLWLAEPAPQCFNRDVAAFLMAQSERVDDAPLGLVEPDPQVPVQGQFVAAQVEGVDGEAVPGDQGLDLRMSVATGQRDIDAGRDDVGEVVPGQRSDQAQGRVRSSVGDLGQIGVGGGFVVGPLVEAAADLFDQPGVP